MSIDYRTLLADKIGSLSEPHRLRDAAAILATRIPDLCPDCDQGDVKHLPYSQTCTHPNAPTIADLLRWGENVARMQERPDRESCVEFNGFLYGDTPDLLAALRTEADR